MCASLRCRAQVCLLAAVLCGSIVCPFPMSNVGGLLAMGCVERKKKSKNKS